jgi:hypothetical protein
VAGVAGVARGAQALRRAPPATDEPLREQPITLRLTVHRAPHIFASHILSPHRWRALRRRIPRLLLLSGQPARE